MYRILFHPGNHNTLQSSGLLVLRLAAVLMALLHGYDKLDNFSKYNAEFGDPIGLGPTMSLILTIFAEFFCSLAVAAGLLTRWAALPPAFTMGVAAFIVHANDKWEVKELACTYLIIFLTLVFTGAGSLSADGVLSRRRGGK
jgi:putative oxidoreductase